MEEFSLLVSRPGRFALSLTSREMKIWLGVVSIGSCVYRHTTGSKGIHEELIVVGYVPSCIFI